MESISLRAKRERFRRSSALLLVLACIALLSIMIIALFLSLTSEVHSSKLYASSASVKLLSQTAVNLVEGEIYQATSNTNAPCWASQPGMIRTYDTNGNPYQFYKLYSDAYMTGAGAFDHTSATNQVPDGTANSGNAIAWYNQAGVYVDLNQPLSVNGTNQYPIVDGDIGPNDLATNFSYDGGTTLTSLVTPTPSTGSVTVYQPFYNNSAGVQTPQVSGFWVNSNAPINSKSPNQIPMPVKWLYVLQNGSIAVPDTDTAASSTVTFANSPVAPTGTNTIVGRIAFWTDDETGKVNLNTAAEGAYNNATTYATSFNDTPRVCTPYDLNLQKSPSYQNEFQRYPGHPATVSLSTVFGNLTANSTYPENIYSTASSTNIAPRTVGGGSTEATVAYSVASSTGTATALLNNRLYATPDELLLSPSPASTGTRTLTTGTLTTGNIDQAALRRAQFFITTSSRAPDVNLFNLPRVCIWPINGNYPASNKYTTPYDDTIAFCTTIAGLPYYFQRENWMSPNELYSVPTTDPTYVQRNWTLVNYLKYLCGQSIPGFGGNFAAKYATALSTTGFPSSITAPPNPGTDMDQILMEIFDYVRSTNLYDTSLNASTTTTGNQFNPTSLYGRGEVVPSYNGNNGTKGFGRYPTISKAGLLFIASGDPTNKQVTGGTVAAPTYGTAVAAGHTRVQAALVFQLFDPSQSYPAVVPDCQVRAGNSSLTWNPSSGGTSMFSTLTSAPSGSSIVLSTYRSGNNQATGWGGEIGTQPLLNDYGFNAPTPSYLSTASDFVGTGGTGTISFSGSIEVQLVTSGAYTAVTTGTATSAPNSIVQDITFTFPAAKVQTPTFMSPSLSWSGGTIQEYPSNFIDPGGDTALPGRFNLNLTHANSNGTGFIGELFVGAGDVLQSIQSASGDLRLIAANATIPSNSTLFGPHQLYGQYASPFAHSFIDGLGMPLYGATRGQLAANATAYWSSATTSCGLSTTFNSPTTSPTPSDGIAGSNNLATILHNSAVNNYQTCEPEGFGTSTTGYIAGVTSGSAASWVSGQALGDYDNGFGEVRDGAYINKTDEGGLIVSGAYIPYFMDLGTGYVATGNLYFSPARQMPSAVMFGSLPTGVFANRPWQTLLFHPDTSITTATGVGLHAGGKGRKGTGAALAGAPPDYLLLDLFTMPVVEPYAISEPLSTAGRINMNYLIVPFTYINRDTGLRAVLESQQMLAVPNADSGSVASNATTYKQMFDYNSHNPAPTYATAPATLRFSINLDETLKYFAQRFYPKAFKLTAAPDIFRSPAEICSLDLVPNDPNDSHAISDYQAGSFTANMAAYWNNHQLTGTNSKDRPYANIYPLLTTKSNSYTVHFRVQSLQPLQGANAAPTQWREGTDVVLSEYRGSQTIERYVDASLLAGLPDYAYAAQTGTLSSAAPLSNSYRFRVDSIRQFSP